MSTDKNPDLKKVSGGGKTVDTGSTSPSDPAGTPSGTGGGTKTVDVSGVYGGGKLTYEEAKVDGPISGDSDKAPIGTIGGTKSVKTALDGATLTGVSGGAGKLTTEEKPASLNTFNNDLSRIEGTSSKPADGPIG